MDEIIYFELNHWSSDYYPAEEPFESWMSDYYETKEEEEKSWIREPKFLDKYCKDNELIMVVTMIDMSVNFCVTAKKSWVEKNCPALLTKYRKFLREPEDGCDTPYGSLDGCPFLEYNNENIGVHYLTYDSNKEDFVEITDY